MPKFLNNIDLNSNQLLSPVIHVSSQSTATNGPAGNATGTEGQIFYNSHAKALYFRDDSAWRPIGDISGVSAGAGLSGGGTGGDVTLTIDISEFSAVTPTATDSFLTLDSDGSTEQLTTISALATLLAGTGLTASSGVLAVGNAATVTTNANLTGHITSSGNAAVLGSFTVAQLSAALSNASISGNNTGDQTNIAGNAATVTTNANLTGHITSTGNAAVLGSFTVAQLSAALSNATISGNNSGDETITTINALDITEVGALASGTIATGFGNIDVGTNSIAAGSFDASDGNIDNVGTITLDEIDADSTTIKIGDQDSKSIIIGKTHPTNTTNGTSVSVEQDLTVKGKLVVQGDIETSSTSNTVIKDAIIQITGAAANTANTSDIGFVFDRGSSGSVAFAWDEGENPGAFKLIATGDTAASSDIGMTAQTEDGNNVAGTSAPQGYQSFYAGNIKSVGNTSGFYGNGANITGINGSNISSGTIAAARVGVLATSKITSGTFANARISSGSVTQHVGDIVHDSLSGYAANEHFTQANITTVGTIGTGVWQGTAIASAYLDSDTAHVTQTQTLTNKTLTSPVLNTGVSGTAIKDQDDMSSNSDSHLATQQSIKAYVDAQTSGDSNTGGRQAFVLNNSVTGVAVSNSNKTYTITHGMGSSFNYGVEVIRNAANSGGGETVYTDVTRTATTVVINFAVAPTAGDYTALVCKY